jgi:arginine deiminase
VVLTYHDRFEGLQDQIIRLPEGVTFEGGDLLMASERVVLIGHSERTSFGAIMAIARDLFGQTPVEHVLAVELPKKRSCMHLDTVLTFSAPDECILFPPLVEDPGFSYAVHFMPGSEPGRFVTDMRPHLQDALQDLTRRDLTFIPCGGGERIHQQREQWTDGANVFAAAPEAVIGYDRNQRTFEQMRNHGYHVVSADNFLSYYENSTFKPGEDRVAIQLTGTELSRGRGGPRCMTLPIARSAAPGGHAASDDA